LGIPLDIRGLDPYNKTQLIFSLEGTSNSGPTPVKRKIEFLAEMYNPVEELDFFLCFWEIKKIYEGRR